MPSMIAKTKTGIGRKAVITDRPGLFEVKLYSTYIYSEENDRVVTLGHGGWVTPTTARYMNQALAHRGWNARVFVRKGEMFVECATGVFPFENGQVEVTR